MAILQNANAITPASGFELKSGRFEAGDSSSLARTFNVSNATDKRKYTLSFWVKRGLLSTYQSIFSTYNGSSGSNVEFVFDNTYGAAGDKIDFYYHTGSGWEWRFSTLQEFRDPSAWYHFVLIYDSTQGPSANRIRLYVNGERVTALAGSQGQALMSVSYTHRRCRRAI